VRAPDISNDQLHLGPMAGKTMAIAGLIGALGLGAGLAQGLLVEPDTAVFFHGWLINTFFVLSLVLGALIFVIIQHLTRAGWSVVVRRVAEGVAMVAPLTALLALPLLLGLDSLYEWTHPEAVAHSPLLQAKSGYLDTTFFVVRFLAYFAIWIGLASFFFRRSTAQDSTGDVAHTHAMQRWAAPGVVLFGVSITFAGFDLLMSLHPEWYSTIFGVYVFAGSFVAFFAFAIVTIRLLQASGRVRIAITPEHFHDLGKLMFGFTVFWAYIGFSQFMLIWYANIPEETIFFRVRSEGGWGWVSLLLLFGHFFLPFVALISRHPKRRPTVLALAAGWMLLMHWLDIFWLVKPALSPEGFAFSLLDVSLGVGMVGLFVAALAFVLRRHPLIPVKDPRLAESLAFENV
jgi:hypothetical protein